MDRRADIWAFGVVLYEMLSGKRAFEGEDVSLTLSAVLQREPEWALLSADITPGLATYLRRCLHKDPTQRVQAIGDVRLAMEGAFETTVSASSEPDVERTLPVWQRPVAIAVTVLAAVIVTGLAVWSLLRTDVVPAGLIRFAIVPPETAPLNLVGIQRDVAISSDGTQVVYIGTNPSGSLMFKLRPIDQFVGAFLRGTENGQGPFFSPDGEWVGFHDFGGTTLQKVSIFGGPPVTLTESPNLIFGASWGTDDQIIFGTNGAGLFRVSGGGGEAEVLTTLDIEQDEFSHTWPFILPDRSAVVFVIGTEVAPLYAGQLALLDLDTGEVTRLGLAGVSPHYVSTGHLVYGVEDGSVRAVPFDAASLEVIGNPVPLVEGVIVKASGAADFDISDNGGLVYLPGGGSDLASRLVTVGRDGVVGMPLAEVTGNAWYPRFSPDGSRVAFAIAEGSGAVGAADLWVVDMDRGTRTRLTVADNNTVEDNNRFYPVWAPDGTQLAFGEGAGSPNRVLLTPADGSGQFETLLDVNERQFPMSWAPDGSALALYRSGSDGTNRDIIILPLDGDGMPVPFVSTPFEDRGVSFSPNGRWLAYVSDKSGQDEIYVRPYPGPGGEVIVSSGGGKEAVWGRSGTELFYRNGSQVMVVPVQTEQALSVEAPRLLFEGEFVLDNAAGGGGNPNYDISPNGEHFVFVESLASEGGALLYVVLNWHQELLERVPVN